MSTVNTYTLSNDYTIDFGLPWAPPIFMMSRVDEIWTSEKKRRGNQLTNGKIYLLTGFSPDSLSICPSEYRFVLARRRDPELEKHGLNIRPLAVTGILLCADGLVLGRRGSSVADDVGLWEPAPAGGLSQDDPKAQVLEELEEELGIAATTIVSAEACGLIEDVESGVFDIIFRLRTIATEQDIRAAYAEKGSDEYVELAIVKPSDVSKFLGDHGERLLPALQPMLRVVGLNFLR